MPEIPLMNGSKYWVSLIRDKLGARLLTRRGIDLSRAFPELIVAMEQLPNVVLDGELVLLDKEGRP